MSGSEDDFTGTMPVREAHEFDYTALQAHMEAHVEGFTGTLEISEFKGGQSNPTYLIHSGSEKYVLRRKPPGKLLKSAHAVDREYTVIKALGQTDVPVPKTYCLCEDPSVIGTSFYIMEFVEGRIFWDSKLPGISKSECTEIYNSMNDVIAKLHNVDIEKVGLSDFGKPGNYVARQVSRWSKQYEASKTEDFPAMDNLVKWLPENIPEDDEYAIVHGSEVLSYLHLISRKSSLSNTEYPLPNSTSIEVTGE